MMNNPRASTATSKQQTAATARARWATAYRPLYGNGSACDYESGNALVAIDETTTTIGDSDRMKPKHKHQDQHRPRSKGETDEESVVDGQAVDHKQAILHPLQQRSRSGDRSLGSVGHLLRRLSTATSRLWSAGYRGSSAADEEDAEIAAAAKSASSKESVARRSGTGPSTENVERKDDLVCSMADSPYYVYRVCAQGLADVVAILLAENPKRIEQQDPKGWTCLHHAASRGRLAVMALLLEKGADLNAKDNEGNTVLHVAVMKNQREAVRDLLSRGADPNVLNENDTAPLHLATLNSKPEMIDELMKNKQVDVNIRGNKGRTALHYAASTDDYESAAALLRAGIKLCGQCDNGFYPIHVAAKSSSLNVLELMLKYGESRGYTRECMLSYADKEANSPLHSAVNGGNVNVVRVCLEHGAKIDSRQESQSTPFHFACTQGTLSIVELMLESHLMQRGDHGRMVLSAKDCLDMTPLHRAAMLDHVDVVRYLVKQGADIDALDHEKRTPLLLAASRNAVNSVKALLDAGANMLVRDATQRHVLHFLVSFGHQAATDMVERICTSEEGKKLVNFKDDSGCTPLHAASKDGNLKFAIALLGLGASVTLKDNDDQSPLHFAACYGRQNTVLKLLESASGPNILNETDCNGMTALHLASMNGHEKVVQLLLQKGALIHRDYVGRTPLHLAAQNGYTHTMKILLSFHHSLLDQKAKNGYSALHQASEANQPRAIDFLLTAGCAFDQTYEELTPMDLAINQRNIEAALVMVRHDRWDEILRSRSILYGCVLLGLIQHLPDVHRAVLDRCHTKANVDSTSKEYWEKYDFKYMQCDADYQQEHAKKSSKSVAPLMCLNVMVRYGRVELLSHAVCLHYLDMKWKAYGRWFFTFHIFCYMAFVACLTAAAMSSQTTPTNSSMTNGSLLNSTGKSSVQPDFTPDLVINDATMMAAIFLLAFVIVNIIKEFVQIYQQRMKYFMDCVNYLEWTLYLTTFVFILPQLTNVVCVDYHWQCASIAVFLAWFNVLLYLQRLESVGLYVVMFLHILRTVLKVILAFSVLFIAFGLTFHILLWATANGSFSSPSVSIVQSVMQLMGEYNFVDVYIRPYLHKNGETPLPFPTLNFIFLLVFVILMPILFVNLLIGLAVGDIEIVQRDAQLKRLAMQVEYHSELEEKLPLWLVKKVDKAEAVIYPNRCCHSNTLSKIFTYIHGSQTREGSHSMQIDLANEAVMEELAKTKSRMKDMQNKITQMHELVRLIVQKMEICAESELVDEGGPREAVVKSAAGKRRALRIRAKMAPLTLQQKPRAT